MENKKTLDQWRGKRLHFIGIGGAGMSGLARIALSEGINVSGSDSRESQVLSALTAIGAVVYATHKAEQVDGADVVIYSSAISQNNPELVRAHQLSLPVMSRAEGLAILMSESKSIAVAGTHGKTTTSSMLTVALQACGSDPSFAIGGVLMASGSNAHKGTGEFFVAEADESDGSFIAYKPYAAIITNVEYDHVDFFKKPEDVTQVFQDFSRTIHSEGFLIYCNDDEGAKAIPSHCTRVSYGITEGSDLSIDQIHLAPMGSTSRVLWRGTSLGELSLQVPGHHNILNAAAALAMGLALGLPAAQLLSGLHSFRGAGRRFELKGTVAGIRVIDDYGHHPTEISVTLDAARRYAGDGRVLVIFQPHRYSRTEAFLDKFADALDKADKTILLEVYAASEKPIPGISASLIADRMKNGTFIPNFIEASDWIIENSKPSDVIVTLGAGDVNSLAPIICEGLAKRYDA